MNYIIDTYAWIEYLIGGSKGKKVKKLLDREDAFYTLESSLAEIYEWCIKERMDFAVSLDVIKSRSIITSIEFEDWLLAAAIKIEKRKNIKDFGLMDSLLLAKQRNLRSKVVTGDKHFKNLSNVVFLNN